jgi:glycine oxidase
LSDEPAIWLPDVARVRNPRVLEGLEALLRTSGIVRRTAGVVHVQQDSRGVRVLTSDGVFQAGKALITAGAWSRELLPGVALPALMPVRGQMLMFAPPRPFPGKVLLAAQGYLIPRADGLLLAGSTIEPGVSDSVPTREALAQLLDMARRLWPALQGRQPVAQWAGIRPGSSRPLPVIGEVPGSAGRVWINTGHYRNGLVCAPASARLVAQLICAERPDDDPEPYSVSGSSSSPP